MPLHENPIHTPVSLYKGGLFSPSLPKGDFPTTKAAVRACIGPTSADN